MTPRLRSLLILAGAVLVLYAPFFAGRVFVPQDFLNLVYPWKASAPDVQPRNPDLLDIPTLFFPIECFVNRSLKSGDIPLWDPEIFMGHPLFASGQSGLCYPPKLFLHWLFSPETARSLSMLLHTTAAAGLMFLFMDLKGFRKQASVLGSLVWILNGQMVGWAEYDHIMIMATHVPLMLWSFEKGRRGHVWGWPLLGLAGAACLHSGHLQLAFYAGLILVGYALFSFCARPVASHLAAVLGSGILVFLLAAPTLVPFVELLGNSAREDMAWEGIQAMAASFPTLLVTLVNPDILGNPTSGFMLNRVPSNLIYAEFSNYFGAIPLLLVLALGWRANRVLGKRETLYWFAFALLMLLFASTAPPYWLFTKLVPPLAKAIPGRSLLAFMFPAALFSANGLHNFLEQDVRISKWVAAYFGLMVTGWLLATSLLTGVPAQVLAWLRPYYGPVHFKLPAYRAEPAEYQAALLDGLWTNYVLNIQLIVVVTGLGILYWACQRWESKRVGWLVIAVTFLELSAFFWTYTPTVSRDRVLPSAPSIEKLQSENGLFRVEKYSSGFFDLLTPYGLSVITGYDSVVQRPVFEALRSTDPEGVVNMRTIGLRDFHHPFFRHAGLKFLMVGPRKPAIPESWPKIFEQEVTLYENPDVLPRVYLASEIEVVDDAVERLAGPDFPHGSRVILNQSLELPGGLVEGRAEVLNYSPDQIEVAVQADRECLLVLNDAYYPGWEVSVNDQPSKILRANGVFRAVVVPEGSSKVIFEFRPASLARGLKLALVGFLLVLVWTVAGSWGRFGSSRQNFRETL